MMSCSPKVVQGRKMKGWTKDKMDWLNFIWVNYNELTTTSLEIMVSKGNHPQMALIQISELL